MTIPIRQKIGPLPHYARVEEKLILPAESTVATHAANVGQASQIAATDCAEIPPC